MADETKTAKRDNTGAVVAAVALSGAAGVGLWFLLKGKGTGKPSLKITNPVVYPGTNLNFSLAGFPPSVTVGVVSGSSTAVFILVDEKGEGIGSYPVSSDTQAGSHTLKASVIVDGKTYSATAAFKVAIGAWYPMLTAIVESPSVTALPPQTFGWQPMLTALVHSSPLTFLPPQTFGWQPMLTALVHSSPLTFLPPQTFGWQPMLTALVNSPTLKPTAASQFVLNVFADPDNAGYVEVIPPGTVFDAYTFVTLRAWSYNVNNYVFAGWYTAGGNLRSTTNPITIQMNADVTYIAKFTAVTPPAPVAIWYASSYGGTAPLWVQFVDQSTGTITSWLWTFGDGQTSSEQNPLHLYTAAGYFDVKLRVTGPGGTNTSSLQEIVVTVPTPSGPTFPAPGVIGDGQTWFWIVFTDNSAAWFDQLAFYEIQMYDPSMIKTYFGPYPSGATS